MPEYLAPGVYVEEISVGAKPIEGVSTTTAAFVGIAEKGPLNKPTLVTSIMDYARTFGGYLKGSYLRYAVDGFFRNGGKRCYIVRVASSTASAAYADFSDRANALLLRISASSAGNWGKNIEVEIADSPQGSTTLYASELTTTANAGDNFFKPKSSKGLNKGDTIKLSDGVTDSAELTVMSIESDGRVMLSGNLAKAFPKESSKAMTVLKAVAAGQSTLSLLSTSGFDAKELIAVREAGEEPVYVTLDGVKPSEKRITWTGTFKKPDGNDAADQSVQGANLVDVKRVTQTFTLNAPGVASGASSVSKTDLATVAGGTANRIRKGDTLMFGTGKTAESVTVSKVVGANIEFTPTLKNTYVASASSLRAERTPERSVLDGLRRCWESTAAHDHCTRYQGDRV